MAGKPAETKPFDRERFERIMDAHENGPFTTDLERLRRAGVEMPDPDSLDDPALTAKLWEVIETLGRMGVVLERTDHLNDRELYSHLFHVSLREEVPDLAEDDDEGTWHVDILGGCSDEDNRLCMMYYADERWRQQWLEDFPDYDMPPHRDLPYDRDSRLNALYAWLDQPERRPT